MSAQPPFAPARWAGLVLAGGRSTRFGAEKAVALLGDKPLMAWCAEALSGACGTVAVNTRRKSRSERLARDLGFEIVLDDPAHPAGPLAGVAAGLAWAAARGFDGLVTLPCDTPRVTALHLKRLIAAMTEGTPEVCPPAAYACPPGRPQGLCAAWRVALSTDLNTRLAAGEHPPVHRWLDAKGAARVTFEDAEPFRNINTPRDLAEAS